MFMPSLSLCSTALLSILLLFPATYASPLGSSQQPNANVPAPAPSLSTPIDASPFFPPPAPGSSELRARDAFPDPQSTCQPNSGTGNTGCNNSGISNSGTGNSGICLTGVGGSGVGDCASGVPVAEAIATTTFILASPTTVYVVQTVTLAGDSLVTTVQSIIAAGATATQTVVVDAGRYNRPGCAYWRTQGYTCNGAGRVSSIEKWLFWPAVVGVMGMAIVL